MADAQETAPTTADGQPKKVGRKGKPMGRKPKLDEITILRICGQIKKGNTIRTAAVACGISQSTFYGWKSQGEADRKDGKTTKYTRFLDEVEHADAVAQQRLLARVLHKAPWKASLEILKRRWPKEFGDKTALTNPDGTPLAPMGGAPINVSFKFDQPKDDNPWQIDESALPPPPKPAEGDPPPDTPPA